MSGTNTTPKKRSFGFDDILSILDGKKTRPPARPALPPSAEPEVDAAPAAEAAPYLEQKPEPPKVIALPEDHTLVPKLLSDIDQKNAEIIRLNNDLAGIRYELREKDFKINSLTLDLASKDLHIKELKANIDGLNAEIARLKAIQPQQPLFTAPAQPTTPAQPATTAPQQSAAATQPIQLTNLLDAVQAQKAAQTTAAQPETPMQVQADAAGARPIKEQYSLKEEVVEEDVATIFKRLAKSHDEVPADAGAAEVPRRPRSAKLYDL